MSSDFICFLCIKFLTVDRWRRRTNGTRSRTQRKEYNIMPFQIVRVNTRFRRRKDLGRQNVAPPSRVDRSQQWY